MTMGDDSDFRNILLIILIFLLFMLFLAQVGILKLGKYLPDQEDEKQQMLDLFECKENAWNVCYGEDIVRYESILKDLCENHITLDDCDYLRNITESCKTEINKLCVEKYA